MKVTALAALLVSATALAQTPPSGTPAAEPKLRSDADIQREIDARVEAAKKELREEMRAQAATVAATSAGSTWETEAASHRKLDLVELHGYFRVRPELLHKLDLDQPPDAGGYWLFPRPDGQFTLLSGLSGGHSIAGTNMRFRLDPTLNISEEVRIRSQIDALDNLVWGSTPQYAYVRQDRVDIGILGSSQIPPIAGVNSTQSNLAVKRVWGEVATPIGLLKFGRMGDQYGLGIVHNDGNCLDCDYGVTVDRFQFVAEPLPGFFIVPTIDFDLEGLVSGHVSSQGQPYDVTNADDSHTFGIILARKDTEQKARAKIDAGGTVFNYGLFFQYRSQTYEYKQNGDTTSFAEQDPYKIPAASLSRISRSAYLFIPDIWLKLERKAFRIEFEAAAYLGKAQRLPALSQRHERELRLRAGADHRAVRRRPADRVAAPRRRVEDRPRGRRGQRRLGAGLRQQAEPPERADPSGRPDLGRAVGRLRGSSVRAAALHLDGAPESAAVHRQ